MAERATDLRSSAAFLRQRWLVLLGAGVVGVALGVLYASLVPPQLGSTSLVLIRGSGGSGSADGGDGEIVTQVQIVLSTPVLQRAGASVTPALSAPQVMDRLDVEGVTSQLISIEAFSGRAREAQALSDAVAQAYIDTIQSNARSVTGQTIEALQTREADLTQQIKALAGRIDGFNARARGEDPKSSAGRQDAQLMDRLTADQSDLALQREKVREELATSQPTMGASQTASIIQPAAPAAGQDRRQRLLLCALSGALIAAACVAGALLIKLRRDPHLRARDDVADAVGSSVLADVRGRPQRSVAEWTALFETYHASAVDAWAFRQLLRALAVSKGGATRAQTGDKRGAGRVEHPASITIITFSGDRKGIAVGPQLAAFAASLGISTRFVVATGHDSAPSLWAACSADRSSDLRPGLQLGALTDGPPAADGTLAVLPATFEELLNGASVRALSVREPTGLAADRSPAVEATSSVDGMASTIDAILGAASQPRSTADAARDSDLDVAHDEVDIAGDELDVAGDEVGDEVDVAAELAPVVTTSQQTPPQLQVVPKHPPADLMIVLAVADRRKPTLKDVPATAVTAFAVSPGTGTREELARLAVAVDDAGRQIDGIVIADPDPSDRTTGRRTLDERARQAPLPVRMTGVSQVPLSAVERGNRR